MIVKASALLIVLLPIDTNHHLNLKIKMQDPPRKQRHERWLPPALGSHPWLVLCHGRHKQMKTFFNPLDRTMQKQSIPEMKGNYCYGCFHGWLIMLDKHSKQPFLLNLVSMERFSLPSFPITINEVEVEHESVNEDEDDNDEEEDDNNSHPNFLFRNLSIHPQVRVFFFFKRIMIYCGLGDGDWTTRDFGEELGKDDGFYDRGVVNYNGELCVIAANSRLSLIDVASPDSAVEAMNLNYKRELYAAVNCCFGLFKLDRDELESKRVSSIGRGRAIFMDRTCDVGVCSSSLVGDDDDDDEGDKSHGIG